APNGKLLASSCRNVGKRCFKLLETETGRPLAELNADFLGQITHLRFAPDSSTLMGISNRPREGGFTGPPIDVIAVWDVKTKQLLTLYDANAPDPSANAVDCYFDMNNSFLPRYALRQYVLGPGRIVEVATGRECFRLPEEYCRPNS